MKKGNLPCAQYQVAVVDGWHRKTDQNSRCHPDSDYEGKYHSVIRYSFISNLRRPDKIKQHPGGGDNGYVVAKHNL